MRWLGLCGALAAFFFPSVAVAVTPSDCEGIEAAIRASQIEGGWTPAEAAAECWQEVKAQEEAEAAQEAEIKQAQDREAEQAARRKSQQEHRVREHSSGLKRAPTVRKHMAEALVREALSHTYRGWRRRNYGYVDCTHGRVNRTHWSCRIGWSSDTGSVKCGRALAEGYEFDVAGHPSYKVSWQISPYWCWPPD